MLTETVRMLLRRWLLCVIVVLLAAGTGIAAFLVIKPIQESKAQVLFVPSVTQPGVSGPTNPLLNLGGSLAIVPTVIQVKASDDAVATKLYREGFTATYKIVPNLTENAGPTLLVSADSKSGEIAQKTLAAVIDEINNQLRLVQSSQNTNSKLFISTVTLTQSTHPEPVRKGQVQKAIISSIAVLIIGLLLVLLLERRRPTPTKRRARETEAGPAAPERSRRENRPAADRPDHPGSDRQDRQDRQDRPPPARRQSNGDRRSNQRRATERAESDRRRAESNRPGRRSGRPEQPSDSSILPGGMPEGSPDPANR